MRLQVVDRFAQSDAEKNNKEQTRTGRRGEGQRQGEFYLSELQTGGPHRNADEESKQSRGRRKLRED